MDRYIREDRGRIMDSHKPTKNEQAQRLITLALGIGSSIGLILGLSVGWGFGLLWGLISGVGICLVVMSLILNF